MKKTIEQLERDLAEAVDDHGRVDALLALAWQLGHSRPERALALSQSAYELATANAYPLGVASSLIHLGRFYYHLSRLDQAQRCLDEALLVTADLDGRDDLSAKTLMGLGLIRWRLGDYAEALQLSLQALDIYRAAGDRKGEAILLANIGMIYGVIGEYDHALEVYQQALTLGRQWSDSSTAGFALNNMAMVYVQAQAHAEALACAEQSVQLARQLGHQAMETHAEDTIGAAYLGMGDPERALVHFRSSVELAASIGDRHSELATWIHIGEAHGRQGRPDEACQALHRALDLATEVDDQEQVRQCFQQLAALAREAGDHEQALAHFERFHAADQAIYAERADMRFKLLQVVHETETARQETEIAHLRTVELEREIAERRQAEAALRESEARFRRLMEELPIGAEIYAPDGTLLHVNAAWQTMWQIDPKTAVGRFNLRRCSRAKALGLSQQIEAAFGGQNVELKEVALDPALVGGNGRMRWLRAHAYPLVDEAGQVKNVVCLTEDITEQKEVAEALRQTQKMESLGVLAGGVAHDFNNLLVGMLGQTSLALGKLAADHPARRHVSRAVVAAEKAADLTGQMLAYSGRGHFQVERLDLNRLLEANRELYLAALPRTAVLQWQLDPDAPIIEADPGQMQQVVMNLLLNAAEAMDERAGRLTVTTGQYDLVDDGATYGRYTGAPLPPGRYLRLTVGDEGSGIALAALTRIFDPFFSTKEQGRGLGLAAVLGIVRGHNGGLAVHSRVGQGTTVELLFPACTVGPVDQPPRRSSGRRVLVVDDEAAVREAVTDILDLAQIEVLVAEGGAGGLALYQAHRDEIGLVLLDLSMPGMDGEETLRELRAVDPTVQVVLSSGYSEAEVAGRFNGDGPAGFLKKPYTMETLIAEVTGRLGPAPDDGRSHSNADG